MKPIVKFCLPFFKLKKRRKLNTDSHFSTFKLYLSKMSVYIFIFYFFHIQIFFLVNFQYVANAFYLKIRESSYSILVVQMLFWNHWKQESAGVAHRPRVFTSTFLGKNLLTYIHTYIYIHHLYLSSDLQCYS